MRQRQSFKRLAWAVSFLLIILSVLNIASTASSQAMDFSLTIVKLTQTTEEHSIHQPPSSHSEPSAGGVYKLWTIGDYDYQTDSYNDTLQALNQLSLEELNQRYSAGAVSSQPTDAEGKTTITGLSEGSYYIREVTESAGSFSVPFLLDLPVVDELGNIQFNLTVYPKTEVSLAAVELIKFGLATETTPRDEALKLENIEFHLFEASDDQMLYPLGVDEAGHYEAGAKGTVLTTNEAGRIYIDQLIAGSYFFKEIKTNSPYQLNEEKLFFELEAGATVQLTMDNYESLTGGYRFKKVRGDKTKQPLAGAEFKITQLIDGEYQNVKDKNDQDIKLISGPDGLFEVRDLLLGDYYLVETKAPIVNGSAYQLIKKPIKFQVTSTSYDTEVMEITNLPKLPIIIPGTGDWRLYALLVVIGLIFAVAIFMYRQGDDKPRI